MTSLELARLVGQEATLVVHPTAGNKGNWFTIPVKILDGRSAYGREDVLVEPVSGEGSAWVSADRVKVRGK